jgi:hypothetical protein
MLAEDLPLGGQNLVVQKSSEERLATWNLMI